MARLAVTGASGYIGARLVQIAQARGHQLVVLGREAVAGAEFHRWSLGAPVPPQALAGVDAVIHLAHSWRADSEGQAGLNAAASEALARQAIGAGVPRFVFASTNSARAGALNAYGRVKYATEAALAALPAGRVVSARIGLVYGGPPRGQYAMMRRLTRLTPILPMIGLDRQVQPIHLDEVCAGLLALATRPELDAPCYVLAGDKPISFGRWLRLLRKVQTDTGLILVPLPLGLMLRLSNLPVMPQGVRERVLGLAAASPMPSGDSLRALELTLGDPQSLLLKEEGSEARVLLTYLGARITPPMLRDLDAGLLRAGLAPLGLTPRLRRHPGLIALVEPPANRQGHRLAQALHLTSQVIEAHDGAQPRPGFLRVCLLVARDLLALPLRLVAGGRYK